MEVHVLYKKFTDRSVAMSGMVRHLETLLKLLNILKNLISAYREKKLKRSFASYSGHDTIFCQTRSVNHQRYHSFYLEVMQKIPKEHPSIYTECVEWTFVVKTYSGFSSAVVPDMRLEQSGPRRYYWPNKTERYCDWMGTSIPLSSWHQQKVQ